MRLPLTYWPYSIRMGVKGPWIISAYETNYSDPLLAHAVRGFRDARTELCVAVNPRKFDPVREADGYVRYKHYAIPLTKICRRDPAQLMHGRGSPN